MARDGGPTPAPGWCDSSLRKARFERFVPRTRVFNTKRLNDDSPQTTPVPPGNPKTSNLRAFSILASVQSVMAVAVAIRNSSPARHRAH
jgi:hypothetical protein